MLIVEAEDIEFVAKLLLAIEKVILLLDSNWSLYEYRGAQLFNLLYIICSVLQLLLNFTRVLMVNPDIPSNDGASLICMVFRVVVPEKPKAPPRFPFPVHVASL